MALVGPRLSKKKKNNFYEPIKLIPLSDVFQAHTPPKSYTSQREIFSPDRREYISPKKIYILSKKKKTPSGIAERLCAERYNHPQQQQQQPSLTSIKPSSPLPGVRTLRCPVVVANPRSSPSRPFSASTRSAYIPVARNKICT